MIGYQRKGTSEAGAPMYIGRWRKPPIWLALVCLYGAACTMIGGLISLNSLMVFPASTDQFYRGILCLIYAPTVGFFGISSGLWMLKTLFQMRRLDTTNNICKQVGISKTVFDVWRMERDIVAGININGEDYYNPADFRDAGTLLRASTQPTAAPDTLLRPVFVGEQAAPEQLLRAAE